MRISGTVKFFNGAKGFGFITPEDGSKDVFVHATALEAAGIRSLNEGDKVTPSRWKTTEKVVASRLGKFKRHKREPSPEDPRCAAGA